MGKEVSGEVSRRVKLLMFEGEVSGQVGVLLMGREVSGEVSRRVKLMLSLERGVS